MPLQKIPALLLIGLGIHVTMTAPTPPTPKNERRRDDLVDINSVTWVMKASNLLAVTLNLPTFLKVGYWIFAIIELCVILAGTTKFESNLFKRVMALLLPNGQHPDCIRLTPTTTFATILVVLGAAIRYWCFREMGKHFTFHITLLKDHKLVTTGPYSIVRHPSYTGAIFLCIGQLIWYTARGSWLRESLIYQMKLSWLFIAPVMLSILLPLSYVPRRILVEDAMLKRGFGKAWDEWAKAVPYRSFPGVYWQPN